MPAPTPTHHDRTYPGALRQILQQRGVLRLYPPAAEDTASPAAAGPWQVHIFAVEDDGAVVVERPHSASASATPGGQVQVLALAAHKRWLTLCPIIDFTSWPADDEADPQPALRLGPPSQVVTGETRRYCRIDVTPLRLPRVLLGPADAAESNGTSARPLEPKSPHVAMADLVNISGSGIGVNVHPKRLQDAGLRSAEHFGCRLELPGEPEPLTLLLRTVRRQQLAPHTLHLGMKFVCHDAVAHRQLEDRMLRITTQLERELLQRRSDRHARPHASLTT